MEFWNNASTGMKILIVVVIAAAVIALIYIVANAFGGAEEPTAPIAPVAPVATQAPVPTPKPSEPPVAVISGATQTQVGQPITLSAADSRAAEGSQITGYLWELGDGVQSTNVDVTHIYQSAGRYEVKLTVTDDQGLDNRSTIKVEVTEAPQPTETPEAPPPTESPSDPSEALEGRDWTAVSVLEDTEITAIFVRGKVSGSGGCNTYTGNYQTSSASEITISDLKGGRVACDQPIMDQENNYLTALGAASSFQVQGDQLVINSAVAPLQYLATGR